MLANLLLTASIELAQSFLEPDKTGCGARYHGMKIPVQSAGARALVLLGTDNDVERSIMVREG